MLVLATLAAAAALGSGIAAAANITCTVNPCLGTPEGDSIEGTTGTDDVRALAGPDIANGGTGGSDVVRGNSGKDNLYGDVGFDRSLDGTDEVYGGKGPDDLSGAGQGDLLKGGPGRDSIDAREDLFAGKSGLVYGVDTVKGGGGDDEIDATEVSQPAADEINCGPGRDQVSFDQGLDTIRNCEEKNPS